MKHSVRVTRLVVAATGAFWTCAVAADAPPPARVTSCEAVRAYIDATGSMTMDKFKQLVAASNSPVTPSESRTLDGQCKASTFVKNTLLSQHLLTKPDGQEIRINARVTMNGSTCQLSEITVVGC